MCVCAPPVVACMILHAGKWGRFLRLQSTPPQAGERPMSIHKGGGSRLVHLCDMLLERRPLGRVADERALLGHGRSPSLQLKAAHQATGRWQGSARLPPGAHDPLSPCTPMAQHTKFIVWCGPTVQQRPAAYVQYPGNVGRDVAARHRRPAQAAGTQEYSRPC